MWPLAKSGENSFTSIDHRSPIGVRPTHRATGSNQEDPIEPILTAAGNRLLGPVPLRLQAFGHLTPAGLDDPTVDQDMDPIDVHVAQDPAVVGDDQDA